MFLDGSDIRQRENPTHKSNIAFAENSTKQNYDFNSQFTR